MRKIIESVLASRDGVIEDPAWVGDYVDENFENEPMQQLLHSDAMLMGRRTYELFERDWSARTDDFGKRVNDIRKYVFSSTLETTGWSISTLVRGDVAAEVRKLKERDGGHLTIWGHGLLGANLARERPTR